MSEAAAQIEASVTEIVPKGMEALIRYDVSEAEIAKLGERFAPITFDTAKGYEDGRKAIATMRELRLNVDRTRKNLKSDSLQFGRAVDRVARHYTDLIEPIESELQAKKDAVDAEKERVKQEAEAAKIAAIEAQVRAEREAEEARIAEQRAQLERERAVFEAERQAMAERERVAREAREEAERAEREARDAAARIESERVAAEQQAERERLAADRARLAEEQRQADEARRAAEAKARAEQEAAAAELRRQQEAIDADRRAVEAERARVEQAEAVRLATLRTEQETRERIERERVEAEAARVAEQERQAELAARREALKPDVERIRAFAAELRTIKGPVVKAPEAKEAITNAELDLDRIIDQLNLFGAEAAAAE